MRIKHILICCIACLMMLTMVACNNHGLLSDDFVAGDTVTPEELLEISRELFTSPQEPAPETEKETESKVPETLAPDATVYWLKNGSVYHATKDCHHISRSDPENIQEGTVQKALDEGKERLCSSCAP